jgi:hypothetical protein
MAWTARLASVAPMADREEEAAAGKRLAMVLMDSPVAAAAMAAQVLMAKLEALGILAAGVWTVRLASLAEPVLRAAREALVQTEVTDRTDRAALMVPTERGARMVLRVSPVPMEWLARTERAAPMAAAEPTGKPVAMGGSAWPLEPKRSCLTPGISTGEMGAPGPTVAPEVPVGMAEPAVPVAVEHKAAPGLTVVREVMVPMVRRVVTAVMVDGADGEG